MTTTKPQTTGRIMLRTYLNEDGTVKHGARLAFPKLWEPDTVAGEGKPRFSASLIIGADHPQMDEINAAIKAVAREKWKDKADATLKALEKTDKLALHDGDTKSQYDGFTGNFYVAAASQENAPPTVVDQARNPLGAKSGKPYAGCYVNASLEFWAQDNQYGKRVNCTLRGVQFAADGDAFSAGRPADADEFDDVAAGADAGDFA
jgi:hypothetical protein